MLDLALHPKHGNSCGKIYPHEGYLGVTPVVVEGVVACKPLDSSYLLAAKSISVVIKCQETRSFGYKEERILWEKVNKVWQAEGEYQDLGHWKRRFQMIVPVDAIPQAKSRQDSKDWRINWKLELVVHHKPIQYVGHAISRTYTLQLYDHTTPSIPPPSPPQAMSVGQDAYSSQVFFTPAHGAFGPGDTLPVSFNIKPDDPNASIKKVSLVLERRIEPRDRSPSPPRTEKGGLFRRSPRPLYARLSSNGSEMPDKPEKPYIHEIVKQSTDTLTPGSGGTYCCNMDIDLPKRGNHYDIGETCTTPLVRVLFELKLRVWVKVGRSTKELACPGIPVILAGVSAEERRIAQTAAIPPVTPTKRKHRSSRRGLYMQEGTVDISTDLVGTRLQEAISRASPILPISGVVTNIRPILRPAATSPPVPTQASQADKPSISFAFPSALLGDADAGPSRQALAPTLPPIQSLLNAPPPTYESYSILKDYQQTGRRVSTTTSISEEEEQPCRSRQKVAEEDHVGVRRGLPSLDALGLGLPVLPDDGRPRSRPRTAPIFSTFSRHVPPPLSGQLSTETERQIAQSRPVTSTVAVPAGLTGPREPSLFAFGLATTPGPPQF